MTSRPPTRDTRPVQESLHTLGHYRLLRLLGRGGMSDVYLGYDLRARQLVAVKVMNPELARDQVQRSRFEREAELTTRLNHTNIVRGFDHGTDGATGRHYLVLEYIDGPSARHVLDQMGRLSVSDVVHIGLAIAKALKHLHGQRYIHRDIKPDNILLAPNGDAKLGDLGLVRWGEHDSTPLTAVSEGFGTSHYMPVEQSRNAHFVDERSDIFALGATLYHLLAGRVPFPGDEHHEVTRKKQAGVFAPAGLLNPAVPPVLDAILLKMLDAAPDARYRTADQAISALLRSRLVSGLPSFIAPVDGRPDQLSEDLASLCQPTRPDLSLKPSPLRDERVEPWWFLRYRDRKGLVRVRKGTTEQICRALGNRQLKGEVFASRQLNRRYRPLADFPEFHSYFAVVPSSKPIPLTPPRRRLSVWYRRMLTSLGLGLFVLAGLASLCRLVW